MSRPAVARVVIKSRRWTVDVACGSWAAVVRSFEGAKAATKRCSFARRCREYAMDCVGRRDADAGDGEASCKVGCWKAWCTSGGRRRKRLDDGGVWQPLSKSESQVERGEIVPHVFQRNARRLAQRAQTGLLLWLASRITRIISLIVPFLMVYS